MDGYYSVHLPCVLSGKCRCHVSPQSRSFCLLFSPTDSCHNQARTTNASDYVLFVLRCLCLVLCRAIRPILSIGFELSLLLTEVWCLSIRRYLYIEHDNMRVFFLNDSPTFSHAVLWASGVHCRNCDR